jgi:hypothetical protein
MPGYVDHSGALLVGIEVGETEVDRQSARALFLEPIGLDAGQRLDERGSYRGRRGRRYR